MKVILTNKRLITSKKGDVYSVYQGITEKGSTVELFLNADDASRFSIPVSKIMTPEVLSELFATAPQVDVQFNQQGRVEDVTV